MCLGAAIEPSGSTTRLVKRWLRLVSTSRASMSSYISDAKIIYLLFFSFCVLCLKETSPSMNRAGMSSYIFDAKIIYLPFFSFCVLCVSFYFLSEKDFKTGKKKNLNLNLKYFWLACLLALAW